MVKLELSGKARATVVKLELSGKARATVVKLELSGKARATVVKLELSGKVKCHRFVSCVTDTIYSVSIVHILDFMMLLFSLQNPSEVAKYLPDFVVNHGVVSQAEVQKLLNESMVRKFSRV